MLLNFLAGNCVKPAVQKQMSPSIQPDGVRPCATFAERSETMTNHKITFLTDVSQVETDDACGMKYWLQTFEGGVGTANRHTRIPHAIVAQTIEDLRTLSNMDDISEDTIT